MTEQRQPPSLEKVKQRAAKMQEICKRCDALILVTDYMIAELEEQIRQQPNEVWRRRRAMQLLNLERALVENTTQRSQSPHVAL